MRFSESKLYDDGGSSVDFVPKMKVISNFKGATSRFVHLEKFSLNFSSLSFLICFNLLHPQPSLFLYGLLLSLCLFVFFILVNYFFRFSSI